MDEMLPDTECPPGRAVTVLEVSLDTIDSGRGMNSRVSEKPTRARVTGLAAGEALPLDELESAVTGLVSSPGTLRAGSDSTPFRVFSTSPAL